MPRQAPRLDPDDPVQALALELRIMVLRAGSPPVAELARKMSCSHPTVSAYLNGRRLPPPDQLRGLVQACGGDWAYWQRELEKAHEQRSRLPARDAPGSAEGEHRETRSDTAPADERVMGQDSPPPGRRRLAAQLRQARELRGKSVDTVAGALGWPSSKVSGCELGTTGLQPDEAGKLLDYYKITGPGRTRILALVQDSAQKGWWEERTAHSPGYRQLISLEHEAASIAIWHDNIVPGLLQTEGYARHVISSYGEVDPIAPSMIERLISVQMRRQVILDREEFALSVVLEESVLRRRIGSAPVMYEQLCRLAVEIGRPSLTLRVLPLDAQHRVLRAPFVVFGFGEDDGALVPDVAGIEHSQNDYSFIENERDAHLHRIAFQKLADASLSPADSRNLIMQTAEALWAV